MQQLEQQYSNLLLAVSHKLNLWNIPEQTVMSLKVLSLKFGSN